MEQTDVLNPQNLSKLILQIAGAEDASVLITDETLYGSYQQIMSQLQNVLHESAGLLEQTPEQMSKLPEQLGETEPSEQPLDASESNVPQTPTIVVETSETAADEEVAQEKRTQTAETKNEDIPEISDEAGQKKTEIVATNDTIWDFSRDDALKTLIEIHITVSEDDLKEWFNYKMDQPEAARFNTLALFDGRYTENNKSGADQFGDYCNVTLFSKLNIPTEHMVLSKDLEFIYRIYGS